MLTTILFTTKENRSFIKHLKSQENGPISNSFAKLNCTAKLRWLSTYELQRKRTIDEQNPYIAKHKNVQESRTRKALI